LRCRDNGRSATNNVLLSRSCSTLQRLDMTELHVLFRSCLLPPSPHLRHRGAPWQGDVQPSKIVPRYIRHPSTADHPKPVGSAHDTLYVFTHLQSDRCNLGYSVHEATWIIRRGSGMAALQTYQRSPALRGRDPRLRIARSGGSRSHPDSNFPAVNAKNVK
jgi:hypothetical protein